MAGYLSSKMKRKDFEEVYDDFSDFSLSSPARKIRRLDAELPPIIEEEESGITLNFDQPVQEQLPLPSLVTEAVPSFSSNDERALVLYKPVNTPLLQSPSSSNFSITVNSDLIAGFKNNFFGPSLFKTVEDKSTRTNDSLAVVPWVSYQPPTTSGTDVPATTEVEPMESEEVEGTSMEIEEENSEVQAGLSGGLQQWHQQHCLTPTLPQNTAMVTGSLCL